MPFPGNDSVNPSNLQKYYYKTEFSAKQKIYQLIFLRKIFKLHTYSRKFFMHRHESRRYWMARSKSKQNRKRFALKRKRKAHVKRQKLRSMEAKKTLG